MTRSGARRWLIAGVMAALLAGIVWHFSRSPGELDQFRRVSLAVLAITVALQFAGQLTFNEAMLLPLRPYAKTLGFWEFYMVRTGGSVVGSMVPVAGNLAVRLAYLKRRGLTYLEFTWATVLSNVHALAAAAVLAVMAVGTLRLLTGWIPPSVAWLSAGVLAAGAGAVLGLHYLPWMAGLATFRRWSWLEQVARFHASPWTTAGLFVLSLLRHVFNFATFGLLYSDLSGHRGDFLLGGLVYAITSPVRMVNLTPANLGVNEWVVAIAGRALAFDVATGLVVALLFRGIAIVAQAAGVVVAWAWFARDPSGRAD